MGEFLHWRKLCSFMSLNGPLLTTGLVGVGASISLTVGLFQKYDDLFLLFKCLIDVWFTENILLVYVDTGLCKCQRPSLCICSV